MKIVEPYGRMLNPCHSWSQFNSVYMEADGLNALRNIEYCARVSHASEEAMGINTWDCFLRAVVLSKGDWSVAEHEKVTCEFLVDRGITHEIVRHRLASYTQESTRFVNYRKKGGEAKFVCPFPEGDEPARSRWEFSVGIAEHAYMDLVEAGKAPQLARSVFPTGLASKIIMTCNLRNWRHFLIMRTTAEAHPQMRQVCDPLLAEFQAKIPIFYEDIVLGMRQAEALGRMR